MNKNSTEPPMGTSSRRAFLKQFAGVTVFVAFGGGLAAQESVDSEKAGPKAKGLPSDFNAFLSIGADGRVTCFTGKIEMGQGVITSLAQMLADELEVPYEQVDMLMGDTDLCPWDAGTWGSMTTRFFGPPLRAAAVEARGVLLELASEKLAVPIASLVARDGVIFDRENQQQGVTYGQLTEGRQIERHLTVDPEPKDVSEFRIMGKPMLRRDSLEKVTGKAKFTADIRVPGMLYAQILRPPAHGAKRTALDTTRARAMDGVKVVENGDLVAVLAASPDVANEALGLVDAKFDIPESTVTKETIHQHLRTFKPKRTVVAEGGDLTSGKKAAEYEAETTFLDGYVAHSAMETHAALATVEDGKVTVWASTQNPFGAKDQVAEALGIPASKVRVITPFVGGAFGGKTNNRQVVEAARLAVEVNKPVQIMYSREEEFFFDYFRPAAEISIASGVDGDGKLTFWDYDVAYAGARGAEQFYTVPNHRTAARPRQWHGPPGSHPFATGAWRAPGNSTNAFARESQVDIMASMAGIDPIEFRLQNLDDPRMIRTIKAVAEKFDWKPAASPARRGFGVACGTDAGSYVAMIVQVTVDEKNGKTRVDRVVCAQEMGIVINPQGATIQMEGCIMMGLGYALYEEVEFKGGQLLSSNFHNYQIPRFSHLPKIETHILEANDIPPQGGGEPAIIVVGAAIANAIHDATGTRLKRMAMTPERVLAAIRET